MTAQGPAEAASAEPAAWLRLQPEWQCTAEDVFSIPEHFLAPTWRMMVLGDGSPTRHLHLLSGSKTKVDVIDMASIGSDDDGAPSAVELVEAPRVRRQVWLENERGERMGYATSWWNEALVKQHLRDEALPIWVSLASRKTEIFREILGVYRGTNSALEAAFGHKGPFWGRHYIFWHNGRPMTLIYEVFSPHLETYLGPMIPSTVSAVVPSGEPEAAKQEKVAE